MAVGQRNNKLTVVPTESNEIESNNSSTTIIRRKNKQDLVSSEPTTLDAQAVAAEEFNLAFDPDMRAAILLRLAKEHQSIYEQSGREEQLARALEISRLTEIESARERGIQKARAEFAQQQKIRKQQAQQEFISRDLPAIADSLSHLHDAAYQKAINDYAEIMEIEITWREGGNFSAKPRN